MKINQTKTEQNSLENKQIGSEFEIGKIPCPQNKNINQINNQNIIQPSVSDKNVSDFIFLYEDNLRLIFEIYSKLLMRLRNI